MNLNKHHHRQMPIKSKRAAVMLEAMLGMIVFGLILALYIPGIMQMQEKIHTNQVEMEELRIFYNLVQVYYSQPSLIDEIVAYYGIDDEDKSISQFNCDAMLCEVLFVNGNYYSVEKER